MERWEPGLPPPGSVEPSSLPPPKDWRGTPFIVGSRAIYSTNGSARQNIVEVEITGVEYGKSHRWRWCLTATIVDQSCKPIPTGLKAMVSVFNLAYLTVIGVPNGEPDREAAQAQGSVASQS